MSNLSASHTEPEARLVAPSKWPREELGNPVGRGSGVVLVRPNGRRGPVAFCNPILSDSITLFLQHHVTFVCVYICVSIFFAIKYIFY
uniref:Uncharacterized protein n=1 Tax=Theropithecus gelada TaxID=9565 RepID=A0A8D2FQC3_THEGE